MPTVWAVTHSELAIVRLHGRNAATWDDKAAQAASDRFNYDYSDAELASLAPHIHALAEQTLMVQVIFNNNHADQGQRNAKTLERIIEGGVYRTPRGIVRIDHALRTDRVPDAVLACRPCLSGMLCHWQTAPLTRGP